VLDRHRVGDHDRVGETEAVGGPHDLGDLVRVGNSPVEVVAGVGDVKTRESQRPIADDGDAERLEAFQGRRHIEDRLHTGADNCDGSPGQSREICRLVESFAGATVDTTDPAGCQDADSGKARKCRRRSDSGRRVP
jgi:hypothetical protein